MAEFSTGHHNGYPLPQVQVRAMQLGGERGIALVIVLVMLVLLSILGAWALSTSSADLQIVNNYRNMQQALYAADAMVAYGSNSATLTTAYSEISGGDPFWESSSVSVAANVTGAARVEFIRSGALPPGSIYDADLDVNGNPKFHGLYFAVTGTGKGSNNAQVIIESGVVQVVSN